MEEAWTIEGDNCRFICCLYLLPAGKPWESPLTSLGSGFLICKIGIIIPIYGVLLWELKCNLCKDLTVNKYQFSHSTFNRRKPIGKASIWEPERSMFKIMRRKRVFLFILVFTFVVSKPMIPKTWMFESEQMNERIMWTRFSLFLLIISDSPPPA